MTLLTAWYGEKPALRGLLKGNFLGRGAKNEELTDPYDQRRPALYDDPGAL
jgi:hypothetical protein